jgi:hypothetical protein
MTTPKPTPSTPPATATSDRTRTEDDAPRT